MGECIEDSVGEEVLRGLYDQFDQNGYFACFHGSESYEWIRDHGLIQLGHTMLRIFNYVAVADQEFYVVHELDQLVRTCDSKMFDPIKLLDSRNARTGWEIHHYDIERLMELRNE